MNEVVFNVARDFSRYPGGRYKTDGSYSAEALRDMISPALKDPNNMVVISLDGVLGYASSFLEELFGGLVRQGFPKSYLDEHLALETKDTTLVLEINSYIEMAQMAMEQNG